MQKLVVENFEDGGMDKKTKSRGSRVGGGLGSDPLTRTRLFGMKRYTPTGVIRE